MSKKGTVVLAYSGGLDTSILLKWLQDQGHTVATYTSDLGQTDIDADAVYAKAKKTGASQVRVENVQAEFVDSFILPAIRANAKYEGRYLLGTSLARPLTAQKQIEFAKSIGATALAHGSTGKGNDQVRFELAYRTLAPEMQVIAPWKEPKFLKQFQGRDDLLAYARKHKIQVKQSSSKPWSTDGNLMHESHEAGILEDPMQRPTESVFEITRSPKRAPDVETILDIEFRKGNPVKVTNLNDGRRVGLSAIYTAGVPSSKRSALDIFVYLNQVAGRNGVGRLDMVESRFVGMKSRGVYETPAGTVLHIAHQDLEAMTLDREVLHRNLHTSLDLAKSIYNGFWFSPEREAMQRDIDATQDVVNGTVRVALYKGNVTVIGRSSDTGLYNPNIASMHVAGGYDPTKARGFIDILAGRLQENARRNKKMKGQSL